MYYFFYGLVMTQCNTMPMWTQQFRVITQIAFEILVSTGMNSRNYNERDSLEYSEMALLNILC